VFDTATTTAARARWHQATACALHRRPREAGLESSEYGDGRLLETLLRHRRLDPAALVERLFADVHAWAGRGFDDDATALVVGVNA
jgi:hypothetical protein